MRPISQLSSNLSRSSPVDGERSNVKREPSGADFQHIPAGKALFQAGDERQVFRVESGAISHFMQWSDGRHEVIEFAFPGDIIGLGYLSTHVSRAHAMVDTLVSIMTSTGLDHAEKADHVLALQLAAAGEREFDYLRDKALHATKSQPVERMAQYLVALARSNDGSGQTLDFVSDENCSPFIAEMLHMDAGTMGAALLRLQKQGLIKAASGGLHILDVDALERFADAA